MLNKGTFPEPVPARDFTPSTALLRAMVTDNFSNAVTVTVRLEITFHGHGGTVTSLQTFKFSG